MNAKTRRAIILIAVIRMTAIALYFILDITAVHYEDGSFNITGCLPFAVLVLLMIFRPEGIIKEKGKVENVRSETSQ